jgi:calcium-dependent protein kinase
VNISTNCINRGSQWVGHNQTTGNFNQKSKYFNKSISIVKEVEESKEISKIEDEQKSKNEESKFSPELDFSPSSESFENESPNFIILSNKRCNPLTFQINDQIGQLPNFGTSSTKIEDKYDFLGIIGQGAYGKVIKVQDKYSKQIRAWKIQEKNKISKADMDMIRNEIEILRITDHPNIVRVYEFSEDDENFNIIMEYWEGGELLEYICKSGTFTEGMACKILKQILSALSYLHSQNIIHSDVKAENIMFVNKNAEDLHVKIIDFGLASKFNPDEKMSTIQGTPYYIAPEVLKKNFNEKADIWSWGILLYTILCGKPPFYGKTLKEVFSAILQYDLKFEHKNWEDKSTIVKEFIRELLAYDSSKRPSAKNCLKMRWIRKFSKSKAWGTNVISKTALRNLRNFQWK